MIQTSRAQRVVARNWYTHSGGSRMTKELIWHCDSVLCFRFICDWTQKFKPFYGFSEICFMLSEVEASVLNVLINTF